MKDESVVAVDVGGTNIRAGYSRLGTDFAEKWNFSRPDFPTPSDWLNSLLEKDEELKQSTWVVGVPGSVIEGSRVEETPNLPSGWSGESIPAALDEYQLTWCLENDANLAALGEAYYGAAQEDEHLVCVTLGTGVGAGLVIERKLYTGATGAAGELGHLKVEPGGRSCGCGRQGCLETYASATGMERTYRELTNNEESSEEIVRRAEEETEEEAQKALEQTGRYLGRGLALLINLLEPESIYFSGGMARDLEALKPYINEGKDPNLFAARTRDIPLYRACLEEPALYGALALGEN